MLIYQLIVWLKCGLNIAVAKTLSKRDKRNHFRSQQLPFDWQHSSFASNVCTNSTTYLHNIQYLNQRLKKLNIIVPLSQNYGFVFQTYSKGVTSITVNKHNKAGTLNLFCWLCNLYARIVIQTAKWNFDLATERHNTIRNMEARILCLFDWWFHLGVKDSFATINKIFQNENNSHFQDEKLFVIALYHCALDWRAKTSMTHSERIVSVCVAKHAWLILAYSHYLRKSKLDLCTDFNS